MLFFLLTIIKLERDLIIEIKSTGHLCTPWFILKVFVSLLGTTVKNLDAVLMLHAECIIKLYYCDHGLLLVTRNLLHTVKEENIYYSVNLSR